MLAHDEVTAVEFLNFHLNIMLVPLVHKTLANMFQPPIRQSSLYSLY